MSNAQKLREAIKRLLKAHRITVQATPKTITEAENQLREIENAVKYAEEALATTEPAVNQQLTTAAPMDEREAFEREMSCEDIWGHRSFKKKPNGRYENWCVDLMWDVWKARAALQSSVADAVLAEREACAKVCEAQVETGAHLRCAAAIRARSETSTGAA